MTIWLDIDDLLTYLTHHNRPSGIQRVVYELSNALDELGGDGIQFVRRGENDRDLQIIEWSFMQNLFRNITTQAQPRPSQTAQKNTGQDRPSRRTSTKLNARPAPPPLSFAAIDDIPEAAGLQQALRLQKTILGQVLRLPASVLRISARATERHIHQQQDSWQRKRAAWASRWRHLNQSDPVMPTVILPTGRRFEHVAQPGDIFLTLGAPWHRRDYDRLVRWLRDDLRMSYGLLMYDLVPVRCPEWCNRDMILAYTEWHENILPLADVIFVISKATAADVQSYLTEQDIGTSITVQPIPLGTGFGLADIPVATEPLVNGSYVLFVSTLEARKNHALLFRVWRRLLEDLPEDQVPTLVFAGREGWLVSDLMQQLENARWLNGKIRFIQNPTDAELRRLYADCSFTVFPSFFEGWGLPVTESLSMGRPCVASGTTSIPEAGGSLARYFNPRDTNDAYRLIYDTITNQTALGEWTEQVRSHFTPVPWTDSARAILAAFDRLI
ncbi:MAG: glycosyltransferase family 1 protein [Gluconobacter sp.]|uniref:glycosyltransferase family 4 protein n=1 Tax=Gluconobacter sp. TaxID=1876758 RepID=UPI0039E80E73